MNKKTKKPSKPVSKKPTVQDPFKEESFNNLSEEQSRLLLPMELIVFWRILRLRNCKLMIKIESEWEICMCRRSKNPKINFDGGQGEDQDSEKNDEISFNKKYTVRQKNW